MGARETKKLKGTALRGAASRGAGAREYAGIRPDEVVATAHAALQGTAGACESCGVEIG